MIAYARGARGLARTLDVDGLFLLSLSAPGVSGRT